MEEVREKAPDKGGRATTPAQSEPTHHKLLTDRDVAELLSVSEGFVRNGGLNLPFIKIGRAKRTKLSDVLKYIEQRTVTKKLVKRPDGEVEEIDLMTVSHTRVQQAQP